MDETITNGWISKFHFDYSVHFVVNRSTDKDLCGLGDKTMFLGNILVLDNSLSHLSNTVISH